MLAKLQGMAGEKSRRVTGAGKPFTRNTATYFKTQTAQWVNTPALGCIMPCAFVFARSGASCKCMGNRYTLSLCIGIPQRLSRVSLEQIQ